MSSTSSNENFSIGNTGAELPPFRTIDDFILNKARFEVPPYNDLKKWNNRIIANLLYYQTNYFAFFLTCVILGSFFNAQDFVLGVSALIGVAAVLVFTMSSNLTCFETRRDHPIITLGAIVVTVYYFITMLPSVLVVLFSILLPVFLVLCHASIRLRNFVSKVTQTAERVGLRTTVMGRILDITGLNVKI